MSNFALGKVVRQLFVFVVAFCICYYGVLANPRFMTMDPNTKFGVSFLAGFVLALLASSHT